MSGPLQGLLSWISINPSGEFLEESPGLEQAGLQPHVHQGGGLKEVGVIVPLLNFCDLLPLVRGIRLGLPFQEHLICLLLLLLWGRLAVLLCPFPLPVIDDCEPLLVGVGPQPVVHGMMWSC